MNCIAKKTLFIVLSLTAILFSIIFGHICGLSHNIADGVLRLHIIANSDSLNDQEVKLKVRDKILNDCGYLFSDCQTPEEAVICAKRNIGLINLSAKKALIQNGINSSAVTDVELCDFPTKTYGNVRFPAGRYVSVNVKIGAAGGKNWWCVMYPPLCLTQTGVSAANETLDILRKELTAEEYALITQSDDIKINMKFKLAELIGKHF